VFFLAVLGLTCFVQGTRNRISSQLLLFFHKATICLWCISAVLLCYVISTQTFISKGIFPIEGSGDDKYFWITSQAHLKRRCSCETNAQCEIRIRAIHPDLGPDNPVNVVIDALPKNGRQTVSLHSYAWHSVLLPGNYNCESVFLRIRSDRAWIPRLLKMGEDPRPLALQVKHDGQFAGLP
jgi:hypothetical protein